MTSPIGAVMFLLGVSLWFPGFALINIAGAWGLQMGIFLFVLAAVASVFSDRRAIVSRSELRAMVIMVWSALIFIAVMAMSIPLALVPLPKSATSLASQLLTLTFAISMGVIWVVHKTTFAKFIDGFVMCSLPMAALALLQLITIRQGWDFLILPINNASFELLPNDVALLHGRAFAATPEPSILASLFLISTALTGAKAWITGKVVDYFLLFASLVGGGATLSQSLLIYPVGLFVAVYLANNARRRRVKPSEIFALIFVCLLMIVVISQDETLVSRALNAVDSSESSSARIRDALLAWDVMLTYPFGIGIGSMTYATDILSPNKELGASSGLVRTSVELGLAGLVLHLILGIAMYNACLKMRKKTLTTICSASAIELIQILIFSVTSVISYAVFVGYRNLLHLSLTLPLIALAYCALWRPEEGDGIRPLAKDVSEQI